MAYNRFANQLRDFAERTKTKADVTIREAILGFASSLITKSPVGDPTLWKDQNAAIYALNHGYKGGNFKANWQGGVGTPNLAITDDIDRSGEISFNSIVSTIPDKPAREVFYITNNLPYAQRLEDGWSTQSPPGGMVALTVLEFDRIVFDALTKVELAGA